MCREYHSCANSSMFTFNTKDFQQYLASLCQDRHTVTEIENWIQIQHAMRGVATYRRSFLQQWTLQYRFKHTFY